MAGWDDDRHLAEMGKSLAAAISLLAGNGANHESIRRAMDAKLAEATGHADAVLKRYKDKEDETDDEA